jgi:hypothetical protein
MGDGRRGTIFCIQHNSMCHNSNPIDSSITAIARCSRAEAEAEGGRESHASTAWRQQQQQQEDIAAGLGGLCWPLALAVPLNICCCTSPTYTLLFLTEIIAKGRK